jgi:hypothetical protein
MLHYNINTPTKEMQMTKILKKYWKRFMCVAESFGRARAASALAREGNYKLAREIMSQKNECC